MRRRITRLRDLVRRVKRSLSCGNSNCVEVVELPDGDVIVRDSRNIHGTVFRFTSGEWRNFVARAQKGDGDNLYAFLKWVLDDSGRTLRLALLLAVAVAAAVLAPHLLTLHL